MSELSLLVPLKELPADTNLTAEGVLRAITDAAEAKTLAEHYRKMYEQLSASMRSAGSSLSLILDEVDGEYEKIKALRQFAAELKEAGGTL